MKLSDITLGCGTKLGDVDVFAGLWWVMPTPANCDTPMYHKNWSPCRHSERGVDILMLEGGTAMVRDCFTTKLAALEHIAREAQKRADEFHMSHEKDGEGVMSSVAHMVGTILRAAIQHPNHDDAIVKAAERWHDTPNGQTPELIARLNELSRSIEAKRAAQPAVKASVRAKGAANG